MRTPKNGQRKSVLDFSNYHLVTNAGATDGGPVFTDPHAWALVRGSAADWLHDPELVKTEQANAIVDRFGNAYNDFHDRRAKSDTDEPLSAQLLTLRILEARQAGMLDAVRAVAMIGRPAASGILIRSMYETFLYCILLSTDTGPIVKARLRDGETNLHPTPEELSVRFQSFARHAILTSYESDRERNAEAASVFSDQEVARLTEAGEKARSEYGFHPHRRNIWHPFRSMYDFREHLWPKGGQPRFSTEDIPLDYRTWRELFAFGYTEASHDTHGSSWSHMQGEMAKVEGEDFLRLGMRHWNSVDLFMAIVVAELSMCAVASAEGHVETWFDCVEEHGLHPLCGDVG
jgi:hypothetical protein